MILCILHLLINSAARASGIIVSSVDYFGNTFSEARFSHVLRRLWTENNGRTGIWREYRGNTNLRQPPFSISLFFMASKNSPGKRALELS